MPKYRKKQIVIEAQRFDGSNETPIIDWILDGDGIARYHDVDEGGPAILIDTLEGTMRADVGDWIIQGVKGEFYPCKPHIFEATYEAVRSGTGLYGGV